MRELVDEQDARPALDRRVDVELLERDAAMVDRPVSCLALVVILILIAVVVIGSDFIIGAISGAGSGPTQTATPIPSSQAGVVVPGRGGHWIGVNPDQLASMLGHKDFTPLNVKTPYIGENPS